MFKRKKRLYNDKKYLSLLLSIISDIAITTFFTFFIVMMIWCKLSSVDGQSLGWMWIIGVALSVYIGIPSKLLDTIFIRYKKDTDELKTHRLLFLHCLLSIPTILYWGCVITWIIGDMFS